MADRTAAAIFGDIFTFLAEELDPGPPRDKLARHFWDQSRNYDFHACQMDCPDALIKLGLARKGIDPKHPDDGETMIYGPVSSTAGGAA